MTLKRRDKRRYVSLMHACSAAEVAAAIEKRLQELYGTTALEQASIKVVRPGDGVSILRCALGYERQLLVAVALAQLPVVSLDMSSSAKRLKRRLAVKVNTAPLAEESRG
jgi:RNase P/RNase MRP subunit POP5